MINILLTIGMIFKPKDKTRVFKPSINPVHVGWYETIRGGYEASISMRYWDGKHWCREGNRSGIFGSVFGKYAWRGLTLKAYTRWRVVADNQEARQATIKRLKRARRSKNLTAFARQLIDERISFLK